MQQLLANCEATALALARVVSDPSKFSWAEAPPFASREAAGTALALYFVSIFALHGFVKHVRGGRALPGAQFLFGVHNFILSAISLIMFLGARVSRIFCSPRNMSNQV